MFHNENEVRRSYANGLLGLDDGVITFTLPEIAVNNAAHLFPFLIEECQSYLNNKTGRSASKLILKAKCLHLTMMPFQIAMMITEILLYERRKCCSWESATARQEASDIPPHKFSWRNN